MIVDTTGFVALCADDIQPTRSDNLFIALLQLRAVADKCSFVAFLVLRRFGHEALALHLSLGQLVGVTAEPDVDASPGHVGGHGHRAQATRLGDDVSFTRMVLGVQNFVFDAALAKHRRETLALLD